MFKGSIPIGHPVVVTLTVDSSAQGTAALVVAWSGGGQTGGHAEGIAVPGGFCTAETIPGMKGLLRVVVDMNSEKDKGTLAVSPTTPAEPIKGDTSWLYTVE